MGCGTSMIKYFLFLFNFLTAIGGIALIVLGTLVLVGMKEATDDPQHDMTLFNVVCGILIGLGIFIFLLSFCGCCGAIQESVCLIVTYSVFMAILFLLELAIVAIIFLFRSGVQSVLHSVADSMWDQYNKDYDNRQFWYNIQSSLECCGRDGPSDYTRHGTITLHQSCCEENTSTCTNVSRQLFTTGCKDALSHYTLKYLDLLGYISIGIALFELLNSIFGCVLAGHFRSGYRY